MKIKRFSKLFEEDGGGGAASGGDGAASSGDSGASGVSDASGSGDTSGGGGVAYFNQGNVDGLGAVKNPTVSSVPGDPSHSEPGSGDVSAWAPAYTYTKNSGITGNKKIKKGTVDLGKVNQVKDELGIGKVMSYSQFINN